MNLFITTFESVAVLLGIGLIGFWIIRRRIVPGNVLGFLSPLALDIALPSLIFVNIIQNFSPSDSPDWWQLPLWWVFFTFVAAGLTFVFMFASKKKTRREFAISLFYQNGIFFPLAILASMFPDDPSYTVFLFLFTIFFAAFFFSTYHFFFGKKEARILNWRRIIHPVLVATILAIIIKTAGFKDLIPNPVIQIFVLLGGMTIPLIMIILGGNIYVDFHKKGQLQIMELTKFVIIKNILFPLIFLNILFLIKPTYHIGLIILLQSAVPPVTAVPLVTERSGGDRSIVNQFIVASFISSLVSIPIMVYLFEMLFTAS
ncbi:MAG: AEC family transporter [Thermoplasmatales archaeon]|nr:MAG: AEC family transporter [Thermoplasmatales archaeon]